MERKAVSGKMLTLMLIGMLATAFNTFSIGANPIIISERNGNPTVSLDVVGAPQGYFKGRGALLALDLMEAGWTLKRYLSEVGNEYVSSSGLSAREIETPQSRLFASCKWDFESLIEWGDFACVDDDSAELVIGLRDMRPTSYSELVNFIVGYGGELINTVSMDGKIAAVVADIPFAAMSTFALEVKIAGLSRYLEPNMKFEIDFMPNDPDWPKQWGSHKIEADWAWNTTTGDPSVLVSVIDTGVDLNHPDLAANYIPLGYDWVNNDNDPMDDNGHGTHCAGIIAAVLNNSVGIAGLAQVRIMAEKAINKSGRGWEDDFAKAIIHSADQGADVISMSWGRYATGWSSLLYEALKYAYDRGVLLVGAAGNDAWSLKHYPAAYDEVIAVSATDEFDKPAEFTNFGDWIEVAAPGVDIFSTTWDNSYRYMSGTSMATPHVSGVAALIWSQFPNLTRDQVRIQLRRTADDLGDLGFDEFFGYGRVNARKAVEQTIPEDDLLILGWNLTRWTKPEDLASANVTILNFGKQNQSNITVQLLADDTVVDSELIEFLTSGESTTVNFAWSLTREGIYNVTMYIVPVLGEKIVENNAISTHVLVRIAKVIHVPRDFQTIKEAIDIASSDFTISVASGLYREHVVIYKSVRLVGEHPSTTFIDGNGIGTVIIASSTSNISINGFTIQNSLKIWGRYSYGVYLGCTNGSSINNNVVLNNNFGICLDCSDANTITNNTILNNKATGFILSSSNGNNIIKNGVLNNEASGILLEYSTNNTLRNNDASGNWLNFGVDGDSLSDFINNVDSSNTVNGKPIYYWINQHDKEVPAGAGYVAVINSTRVNVSSSNLTNNPEGLLLAYTTKSVIENVNTSDNLYGIRLFRSDNNNVNDNTIKNNWLGIHVFNSNGNTLSNNTMDTYELLQLHISLFFC